MSSKYEMTRALLQQLQNKHIVPITYLLGTRHMHRIANVTAVIPVSRMVNGQHAWVPERVKIHAVDYINDRNVDAPTVMCDVAYQNGRAVMRPVSVDTMVTIECLEADSPLSDEHKEPQRDNSAAKEAETNE